MHFRDLLADTFHTLWAHKRRTALSMFGIAWGIISIVLMVAATEGLRQGQRQQMQNFGRDILIVNAGRTSLQAGGQRAGRRLRWQDADHLRIIPECPSCRYIMPELGRGDIVVRSRHNSASPLITGALPEFAEIRSITVAEGRYYNAEDAALARRVAFLGTEVAEQLFASRKAVGETIHIGAFPYTVIGVMRRKTQNSSYDGWDVRKVFIPFSTIMRDFPEPPPSTAHDIDRLLVTPKSFQEHDACKGQLLRALGRLHDFDPADKEAAFIWDTVENAKRIRQIIDGMKYFLSAVGLTTMFLGALGIGGVGVMNIMLVSVDERVREIGIRRALGARRGHIRVQFLSEALVITLVGGVLGMLVAYGLSTAIGPIPFLGLAYEDDSGKGDIRLDISLLTVAVSSAILCFIGVLSGLVPALRASRLDPAEALRYE